MSTTTVKTFFKTVVDKMTTNNKHRRKQQQQQPQDYKTIKCLGLEIDFPFDPYGIQRVMMNKLTLTLMNKEHSLIESPTGTGKTLVLLCSSLAWVKKSQGLGKPFLSARMKQIIAEERREKLKKKACTCGRRPNANDLAELEEAKKQEKGGKGKCEKEGYEAEFLKSNEDSSSSISKKLKLENCSENTPALKTSPYFQKKRPKSVDKEDTAKDPDIIILSDSDDDVVAITGVKEEKKEDQNGKGSCDTGFDSAESSDLKKSELIQTIDPGEKFAVFGKENVAASQEAIDEKCQRPIKSQPCQSCEAIKAEEKFSEIFGDTDSADADAFITAKIKTKIPKIYYGTRTHKQITQVIRELNKTPYRNELKMCILSSRERSCINQEVKDQPDRNDKCQELIKSKSQGSMAKQKEAQGCPFYKDQMSVTQQFEFINDEFNDRAWDIEDAAQFGINSSCCPYFGARSLQESADITFSPYNYLLDPTIRKNLNINLSNAIVIFDEAHNIEDICRDSASFTMDTNQMNEIIESINILTSTTVVSESLLYFRELFRELRHHLIDHHIPASNEKKFGDFSERKILNQREMLEFLEKVKIGPQDVHIFKENLKALRGDDDDGKSEKSSAKSDDQAGLNFAHLSYITQLGITLDFMYSNNRKYFNDFRAVISKSIEREFSRGTQRFNRNKAQNPQDTIVYHFRLLCMHPGIAFEKIHSLAWSVIVASGTLSPIESLKSELGCKFSNVLEGAHVIGRDRVFSSIISKGPNGIDLNCSYQQSLRLDFQDEVGRIVKDVCLTVPHGVLCFFPSYDRMENFYQRWFNQKFIAEIQNRKRLYREQKNFTSAQFEQELQNYNQQAKTTGGALLFAVFRGKVSEGIDFADDAARAVITIGIPYPNIKEVTVGLKRDYNDLERKDNRQELMTGSNWYGSQAFRALNQALGRCIRHKDDWGAIIMIDSRLKYPDSMKNISRWLLNNMLIDGDYNIVKDQLHRFVASRTLAQLD